jgi:HAE1 family hydrophobic/amphiphilic exporter-1
LETEGFNYDLRLVGGFDSVGDVADVPVSLSDGRVVRLGSIAEVKMEVTEAGGASRISVEGEASKPAVTLSVVKKTGGNIVRIVDQVKEKIEEGRATYLPEGVLVATFIDRGEFVRESLENVTRSGAQTLVIVFGLLWLFLGWRSAVIAALAIPLTFSMSFLVFDQTDVTLNDISLFSLILSLGLLVDNTIVIVEGIHRERGKGSLTERALGVVNRFRKPLIGGTLTTVAAFFPMLLVTGIIGQFLRVIPIVVTGTLISSLIVALVFIPAVAVQLMLRMKGDQRRERWFDGVFNRFRKQYCLFIDWALGNKSFQRIFIGVLSVLLVIGLSLPFTGLLKTGLFPEVDIDFAIINAELAPGSRLEETDKVARRVEEQLREVDDIESFAVNVGSGTSFDIGGGGSSAESLASFFVNFDKDRERTSIEIAQELRERFVDISLAKVVVEEISAGPPTGTPVELRVVGDNLDELDVLSREVMAELESMAGVINIDRNLRNSAGEFNFVFDREALAEKGLSAASVAQALRAGVFGVEVTTFLDRNGEEISVRMEAREETVDSVDDVLALSLLTPRGEEVLLGQVASVDIGTSIDAIRHRDAERVVTVTASTEGKVTPNEVTPNIMTRMEEKGLPEGYEIQFGGEQQETTEAFAQLYRSMVIAVVLILIILVVEFNSYRQPWIIFLSIPLALIGVLFGLLLFGAQLNFAAFIGLVSLTGIVVNNAIILVDRMNASRRKGKDALRAVKEAAESRLRPIILTTLTTAAGVVPLIWVDEFFRDMAITLITGLMFSSVLTLVLIPILYYRQQMKMEKKRAKKGLSAGVVGGEEPKLSPVP